MSDAESGAVTRKLAVSKIANPMAGKKLTKRLLKVTKKGTCCKWRRGYVDGGLTRGDFGGCVAAKAKALKRGVKEVVKAVRKGEKGCVFFVEAG